MQRSYLQVSLPGVLHVPHGAAVDLLQTLLSPLVLRLQLVQLHPQVLPLLAELVLELQQRRLGLGQLHLQTLLQQGDLQVARGKNDMDVSGGSKGGEGEVFLGRATSIRSDKLGHGVSIFVPLNIKVISAKLNK